MSFIVVFLWKTSMFQDQALMQKSLKAFAAKSPSLANQLGILSPPSSNHRSAQNSSSYREESGSDSDEPLQKSKYFKAREREREEKRLKGKYKSVTRIGKRVEVSCF